VYACAAVALCKLLLLPFFFLPSFPLPFFPQCHLITAPVFLDPPHIPLLSLDVPSCVSHESANSVVSFFLVYHTFTYPFHRMPARIGKNETFLTSALAYQESSTMMNVFRIVALLFYRAFLVPSNTFFMRFSPLISLGNVR